MYMLLILRVKSSMSGAFNRFGNGTRFPHTLNRKARKPFALLSSHKSHLYHQKSFYPGISKMMLMRVLQGILTTEASLQHSLNSKVLSSNIIQELKISELRLSSAIQVDR